MVLVVLATEQIHATERSQEVGTARSRDFIEELRETYPTLPEEATLYVVGVPLPLALFDGVYLTSVVSIYYGDVNVHRVSEEEAQELELSPQPNARVFRYSGYD